VRDPQSFSLPIEQATSDVKADQPGAEDANVNGVDQIPLETLRGLTLPAHNIEQLANKRRPAEEQANTKYQQSNTCHCTPPRGIVTKSGYSPPETS
jgi:hypothetical protein